MSHRRRQQRSSHQQRGYCFLDFLAKRRTNKRSSLIICEQQSTERRLFSLASEVRSLSFSEATRSRTTAIAAQQRELRRDLRTGQADTKTVDIGV